MNMTAEEESRAKAIQTELLNAWKMLGENEIELRGMYIHALSIANDAGRRQRLMADLFAIHMVYSTSRNLLKSKPSFLKRIISAPTIFMERRKMHDLGIQLFACCEALRNLPKVEQKTNG